MTIKWKGVFPGNYKIYRKDELDLPLFEKNLEAQIDAGVEGIILGGTLGEAVYWTSEKETLVNLLLKNAESTYSLLY